MKRAACLLGLSVYLFFSNLYSQSFGASYTEGNNPLDSISKILPKISKDSTTIEITEHVEAMIAWMTEEHYKSNFAYPLIYAEKGLSLAKKSSNEKHIHDARTIIGNTLLRVKDTTTAKKLFLESLEVAKATNDSTLLLRSKGNLANIYYYTEGYKQRTINEYLESIDIALKLKDTTRLFVIHHNLARAFNETNNADQSALHVERTEHYLNLIGNPPHYQASHFHNVGRLLLLQDNPDEAMRYFNKTISICEGTQFVEALIEGYTGLKEALEIKKDYKGVYEISKKLEVYEDEEDKNEAQNIVDVVTAKLTTERFKEQIKSKELEKQLLVEQAERKNILLFSVLGIGIFLLVILGITYNSNQKKKELVKNLQNRNKQYLIAKKKSEEFTKSKAKFYATVSHELRTPLYGVIGLSSILLENKELKKHEKDLKSLKFSANYLLALINDLLHINKIESNSFIDEKITFNLKDLLSTIVSTFEYIRIQHKNTINVKIDKNVPQILRGNSVRLSQILMNLIGNACKFTEKGSIDLKIEVLERKGDIAKIQFVISDTGPGIEKSKLDQIFNEFAQITSKSSTYQGTGLGLPIVKKLVEQANGNILVDSEIGKGTTFKFSIDIAISSEIKAETSVPIVDFKMLDNKKILIVEDNRINQTVTKRILESSGVICEIAQNGEEAIEKIRASIFDLVLMDINMPVKNGIDATREIRLFNKEIPIIALTAVEIEEQRHQIFECGMDDIILKPYDIDRFKNTIILNLSPKFQDEIKKLA